MKRWLGLLLAALLLMGSVSSAFGEETPDPVGVIDGNTYTSELFGFTVTFPETWRNFSLEEIAGTSEYNAGSTTPEELLETLKTQWTIHAMFAKSDAPRIDVSFFVNDYSDDPSMTEETYLGHLIAPYEDPALTMTFQSFPVAGKEHPGFIQKGMQGSYSICNIEIALQEGPYTGEISIHALSEGKTDLEESCRQILALFEPVAAETPAAGE